MMGTTQRPKAFEGVTLKRKRSPPHNHFHCKDKLSVARLKLRLSQDGYLASETPSVDGFIVEIVGVDSDRGFLLPR